MNYSWMIMSLLRWIENDRTSKHGYRKIPFRTTHLQTGWLSLIHNVFRQCTKLLFCWKIFSGKDKRDSITSLLLSPLNCPLDRSYTCTPYIVMKFYLFLLEMQVTELYIHLRNKIIISTSKWFTLLYTYPTPQI